MSRKGIGVIVCFGVLVGCANTSEYMRSQPVTYFPASEDFVVPKELTGLIEVRCMMQDTDTDAVRATAKRQCLYVSADVSKLSSITENEDKTNIAISYLTSLSDMNCTNFLQRTFATKASLDFSKNLISDMASAASAGTAFFSPAVSAALNVGDLVVGKGVESFNATYYFDKSFQAMEAAINAERTRIKTFIIARQAKAAIPDSPVPYDLATALSDIRAYDDACSIKSGLSQLVQLADQSAQQENRQKVEVEHSADPSETILKFYGTNSVNRSAPPATVGK